MLLDPSLCLVVSISVRLISRASQCLMTFWYKTFLRYSFLKNCLCIRVCVFQSCGLFIFVARNLDKLCNEIAHISYDNEVTALPLKQNPPFDRFTSEKVIYNVSKTLRAFILLHLRVLPVVKVYKVLIYLLLQVLTPFGNGSYWVGIGNWKACFDLKLDQ